jgi:uncharacterized damage-inducible protein DinB
MARSERDEAMFKQMVLTLYDYAEWANDKLLTQAAHVTPEQFSRTWSSGYRSLHENFVHFVNADRNWFIGWQGQPRPATYTTAELPDVATLRQTWTALWAERRAYLESLREEQFTEVMLRRDGKYVLQWEAMMHCANHGAQHRSEIAAMLTDAGHSPGDLDLLFYLFTVER